MSSTAVEPRDDFPFERSVTLTDGRRVRLRWIRPSDASLLREGFNRLSPQSRLMRFLRPIKALPDDVVRNFTEVDGFNHVAVVATSMPEAFGLVRGYGVGRFVRNEKDPTVAELAITVSDEIQGQGLGARLAVILAVAARERRVEAFEMSVLWTNTRAHRLLERLGAERIGRDGEVVDYRIATYKLAALASAPVVPRPLRGHGSMTSSPVIPS